MEKILKNLEILSFYICVHKWRSYDIWFLRYKAWRTEFLVNLGHFLPFDPPNNLKNQNFEKNEKNTWRYCHFTFVYHKWQLYDIWFLRYGVRPTQFFVILGYFLPFYPPNNPENQNFEKAKKITGDTITLHMCIINENHMMYGSWYVEHGRQNFFSFWTIFCPFTLLTTQKIIILKKWKMYLVILSFYICVS